MTLVLSRKAGEGIIVNDGDLQWLLATCSVLGTRKREVFLTHLNTGAQSKLAANDWYDFAGGRVSWDIHPVYKTTVRFMFEFPRHVKIVRAELIGK